jgi:hypothetical protein
MHGEAREARGATEVQRGHGSSRRSHGNEVVPPRASLSGMCSEGCAAIQTVCGDAERVRSLRWGLAGLRWGPEGLRWGLWWLQRVLAALRWGRGLRCIPIWGCVFLRWVYASFNLLQRWGPSGATMGQRHCDGAAMGASGAAMGASGAAMGGLAELRWGAQRSYDEPAALRWGCDGGPSGAAMGSAGLQWGA